MNKKVIIIICIVLVLCVCCFLGVGSVFMLYQNLNITPVITPPVVSQTPAASLWPTQPGTTGTTAPSGQTDGDKFVVYAFQMPDWTAQKVLARIQAEQPRLRQIYGLSVRTASTSYDAAYFNALVARCQQENIPIKYDLEDLLEELDNPGRHTVAAFYPVDQAIHLSKYTSTTRIYRGTILELEHEMVHALQYKRNGPSDNVVLKEYEAYVGSTAILDELTTDNLDMFLLGFYNSCRNPYDWTGEPYPWE